MSGYVHPCLVNDANTGPFSPQERAVYNTQQQQQQQRSNMQPSFHNGNEHNGYRQIEKGTERNMKTDEQQYNHTNGASYSIPVHRVNDFKGQINDCKDSIKDNQSTDQSAPHLSFLYDKAQGGEYEMHQQTSRPIPQAPVEAAYPGFGNRANPAPSTVNVTESNKASQVGAGTNPAIFGTDYRKDRLQSGNGSDSANDQNASERMNPEESKTSGWLDNARALRSLRTRTPSPSRSIPQAQAEAVTEYPGFGNRANPAPAATGRMELNRSSQGGTEINPALFGTDYRRGQSESRSESNKPTASCQPNSENTNPEENKPSGWLDNARALRSLRTRTPSPSRWIVDKAPGSEFGTAFSAPKLQNQTQSDISSQPPLPPMSTHPLATGGSQDHLKSGQSEDDHLGNGYQRSGARGGSNGSVSEPSAFLTSGGNGEGDSRNRQGSASSFNSDGTSRGLEGAQGPSRSLRLRERSPSPDILKQRTLDELTEKLSQAQLSRQINNPGQGESHVPLNRSNNYAVDQPNSISQNQFVNKSSSRENLVDQTHFKTSAMSPKGLQGQDIGPGARQQQNSGPGQVQSQRFPRQVSQVCGGDGKESLRNYDAWKAAVNQRKMSLPGYMDSSKMQRFHRQVPPTELPRPPKQPAKAELDSSSIRQQLREGDEPVIEDYEQESIRYKGKMNPSKIFRELQTVTNSNESEIIQQHLQAKPPARRRVRKEEETKHPDGSADDIVDISYVGGKIPSRTFRQLQEAMGEDDYSIWDSSPYDRAPSNPARHVKVVHLRRHSVDNIL